MADEIKLNKWLRDNIYMSENGTIYLSDIHKKLHGKFTSRAIALAMKNEFKGLIVKTARNKEYWAKLTRMYMGVEWKQKSCDPDVQMCKVSSLPLGNKNCKSNFDGVLPDHLYAESSQTSQPEISNSKPVDDICSSYSIQLDHSYIKLVSSDHEDLTNVLEDVTSSDILDQFKLSDKMKMLLESQLNLNKTEPKGRRWKPEIVRLCLTLYCRSPKNYEFLSKSGYLILPSSSQIRRYKNIVDQQAGINTEVLQWMKNEAEIQKVPSEGYEGGLLIDEMSIQEDLQLKKVQDEFHLIGFVECCLETEYFSKLSGRNELKLASHVLQLLFIGHSGFRFPVAHYPTTQTSPHELYLIIWQSIKLLAFYDFHVTYISLDGAQSNRVLMKMFLPENKKTSNTISTMSFSNIFEPNLPRISIIMDYSHMIKKIRNNISKSGNNSACKKLLEFRGKNIVWEHWIDAYKWDITSNTLKIHQKLTQDHFYLNSQLKMRNHLAEEVLDANMLHLMEEYRDTLDSNHAIDFESSIELLKNTSQMVRIFRDSRAIRHYEDPRLDELKKVLKWFRNWEKEVKEKDLTNKEKEKCLISFQTREDIVSCLLGFDELCRDRFKRSFGSIVPSRINSDAIENIFSQQRGIHNGANTNPEYLTYCRATNAIILGQTSISRKSNAEACAGANCLSLKTKKRNPLQEINKNQ